MEEPLKGNTEERSEFKNLKHDIRNQLSAIQLAIEQLRYEIPSDSADGVFYLDTIAASCVVIETLLKDKN
jgi:signal transduction histidine kinase